MLAKSNVDKGKPSLSLMLLCDCSGSMAGERIAAVNTAAEFLCAVVLPRLRETTDIVLELSVIRFANTAHWHIPPGVSHTDTHWHPLDDTAGITSLGAAYQLVADYLAGLPPDAADLPPVIILLSDGKPTDDSEAGMVRLLAQPSGAASQRFAVGIGSEVSEAVLSRFAGGKRTQIALGVGRIELRQVVADMALCGVKRTLERHTRYTAVAGAWA